MYLYEIIGYIILVFNISDEQGLGNKALKINKKALQNFKKKAQENILEEAKLVGGLLTLLSNGHTL